jgi:hypothetical protein
MQCTPCVGKALLATSQLPAGTDSITATYSGNTNYNGGASTVLSQTVRRKK